MTENKLQKWRDMKEAELKPTDIIPWCSKDYTLEKSRRECPLGGCWKYRCYDSKLNASWHEEKEAYDRDRWAKKLTQEKEKQ